MQAIVREKLMGCLLALGEVAHTYRKDSSRFVAAYFRWLEQTEESLAPLRLPLLSTVQSQKTQLLAIEDGLIPPHVQAEGSVRKRQRAATAALLDTMTQVLQDRVAQADRFFEEPREKLAQSLALLLTQNPSALDNLQPDNAGVDAVWRAMQATKELAAIVNYLSAKLPRADRDYCLVEVMGNVLVT